MLSGSGFPADIFLLTLSVIFISGMTMDDKDSLEANASKLNALLEAAVDAIITIDENGIIESVNPAASHLFGYDAIELIGSNVKILMPPPFSTEHDEYIQRYLTTGERKIIGIGREVIGQKKDGSVFPMHLSVSQLEIGGATFFSGIIHDLTDRKAAETALVHAHKMEAVGQLTGGVAHDFNNLLTVVIGNLELLEMQLTDEGQRELLREAQEAADMGARLTERLLAFARRSHLEPEIVDMNGLVLGLTDLLHRTLGGMIDLSTALSPELWMTKADPSQVENMIVNLAVNARDAMPGGGKLVLETSNAIIDESYVASETGLAPGEYVRLSISDTGQGMPNAVIERAFEPFFTTKEGGRGTGLGLSMVYGLARQSGGHATIYSEVDRGTTVNVYLPRVAGDTQDKSKSDEPAPLTRGSGQTILVVEDNDHVRRLTVTRVRQLGYAVLEAPNGEEALEILSAGQGVDLVFTDLVMPGGISGYELCNRVRERYPNSKLLLTSGYAEELVHAEDLDTQHLKLLRKPYRQADLASALNKALQED